MMEMQIVDEILFWYYQGRNSMDLIESFVDLNERLYHQIENKVLFLPSYSSEYLSVSSSNNVRPEMKESIRKTINRICRIG